MRDKYRPQFHFTPEKNWMNDPNGLVYYNGEYHLFYQYHPHGTTWGPMHWGHAVSGDLVRWEHRPVALAADEHGEIFSGSAVVDWQDTSGFFGGKPGLVAIFTHHRNPDSDGGRPVERQSLAYSGDFGRTWTKYEGNPVLADGSRTDYRDPKVFWHEPTKRWNLILASGQTVCIYYSPNLKDWTFASEFGEGEGAHLGVWECPDLFELPVDGDETRTKWVMFVSVGSSPEHPEGSRTQYFIGSFDGTVFRNENAPETVLWLDYGRDNYAGVSWSDVPAEDGRRIYIGWMSNWKYAQVTPTESWRSAMTVPRALSLRSGGERVTLTQQPVRELERLRTEVYQWRDHILGEGGNPLSGMRLGCFEMIAEFESGEADEFGFKVRASDARETVLGYDTRKQELFVDRTRSGEAGFHEGFPGRHAAKLELRENRLRLHILVDTSSVEVFGGDGEAVITDLIFPESEDQELVVYTKGGSAKLLFLDIFPLQSIRDE
ncbi:glycoside hydrolase family 32 protein [Paenibacillus oleatilyticus]|uniref:glycoside hydrolase family 32 protein n=1 Tax=Paenibacillus oleatilyticus TaxID=2594886 RepID=UPI001C2008FF|nr:glycoside hydrolase family 32 protein [Paenibacillus oleatilyticus]MBU7316537.1 glycoside hydrolase family 32 protein [Paenibacillus oleatilyticus]